MDHFAICSNADCNYSTPFDASLIERLTIDYEDAKITVGFEKLFETKKRKPFVLEEIQKYLPADRFCEECGEELMFYCPHCKIGMFSIPDPKFCKHCGKKIKPGKYDGIGETIQA